MVPAAGLTDQTDITGSMSRRRRPRIETTVDGGVPSYLRIGFGHKASVGRAGKHDPRPRRLRTRAATRKDAIQRNTEHD